MSKDMICLLLLFLRMVARFFLEGNFCYALFTSTSTRLHIRRNYAAFNNKEMPLFCSLYTAALVVPVVIFKDEAFYRLISVVIVLVYFWRKECEKSRAVVENFRIRRFVHILTAAIFSVLAIEFSHSASHISIHVLCSLCGIYGTIRGNWILYEAYKSVIMVVHLCLLFLIHKLRFLKIDDIRIMSVNKWVPVSFGLCLISMVYINYNYVTFGNMPIMAPYRDVLLWISALLLPTYLGFYLAISKLTKLLSIKSNCAADDNIFVWIFNPSMIETIHLSIYDSELFMPSFEANRLAFKKKLEKLGIDNGYKGYSEMVFCLILTKLFMGMKGWSFERDIFGQASLVIDTPFPEVRKNIEAIIEKVWLTDDSETLVDGYYLPCCNNDMYDGRERPSAEEFLMQMAKSV